MSQEHKPSIPKLGLGGKFHLWEWRLRAYLSEMGFWGYVSEGTALEVQENGHSVAARDAKCLSIVVNTLDDDIVHHVVHLSDAHSIDKKVKLLLLGNAAAEMLKINNNIAELAFQGSYHWLLNNFIKAFGEPESNFRLQRTFLATVGKVSKRYVRLSVSYPRKNEGVSALTREEFGKKIDIVMRYLVEKGVYRPTEKQNVFSVVAR
eukprot:snap_masked-scaffold_73-processed-gene-0.27-mRNA-1 protein AED:1.00 eAED:1.00 QI:0/0/0/0/1/1/2/0/205